jgi:hypothetical protein
VKVLFHKYTDNERILSFERGDYGEMTDRLGEALDHAPATPRSESNAKGQAAKRKRKSKMQ